MAKSTPEPNSREAKIAAAAPKPSRTTPIIAAVIVLAVVVAVVWGVMAGMNSGSDGEADYPLPAGATGPTGGILVNANAPQNAPALDIYEDPQCPACSVVEGMLGSAVTQMRESGSARVTYHIKTFLDDNLRNDASKRAANAMMCAADQGKFVEYHDAIYAEANRPAQEGDGWTDAQLTGFAQSVGISDAALNTWQGCATNNTYAKYLAAVEEATSRDDVRATPTYRINGKDFTIAQNTTGDSLINAIVEAGGTTPTAATSPSASAASSSAAPSASN